MHEVGKSLMVVGAVLLMIGAVLLILNKIPGLGRLPGDLLLKKGSLKLYFPLTTCFLISILVSLILVLLNRR